MAGVERIEEGPGLDSPNLAEDDSIGSEPKRVFQEVVKRDVGLEGIRLRSGSNYVGFPNMKLRRILDDDNPFAVGNKVRQYPQKSRLAGSRSTAD